MPDDINLKCSGYLFLLKCPYTIAIFDLIAIDSAKAYGIKIEEHALAEAKRRITSWLEDPYSLLTAYTYVVDDVAGESCSVRVLGQLSSKCRSEWSAINKSDKIAYIRSMLKNRAKMYENSEGIYS